MKTNRIISLLALSLVGFSCDNLYEDKYIGQWEDEYVWEIAEQATAVLNDLYVTIAHRPDVYDSNFLDAATDNAMSTLEGTVRELTTGDYSSQSNPLNCWSTNYEAVQMASYYIANGMNEAYVFNVKSEYSDVGERYYRMGQAHFLRAFFHFDLLQVYGGKNNSGEALGIPILTEYVDTEEAMDMLLTYKRPTYRESIDLILADLDEAMSYFEDERALTVTVEGRANYNTAAALKARVALYAASPAYQDNSIVQINDMGSFTVVDKATYEENWANFAGLIYEESMTSFLSSVTSDEGNSSLSYTQLTSTDFADVSSATPAEYIFRFYFNSTSVENYHFMPRFYGKAYTVPTQNLVDAFPMANGYPITDYRSGYDPSNPYVNRDSRFYLNIYYNGADYGSEDFASEDSLVSKVDITKGGVDSRSGNIDTSKNSLATRTGYYLAKFVSKNFNMLDLLGTSNSAHYWPELRKAEVYLSYAEAANEAWGPTTKGIFTSSDGEESTVGLTAYDVIKNMRATSGGIVDDKYLDEVAAMGKDAFRELIQNERRIELAFENHRFFDMRRCLMDLTEPIYGVEASLGYDGVTVEYDMDVVVEDRDALSNVRNYYLPLPYAEVMKGLDNNMGW
ncbi:MAG: RagB/SusD family nutrient uptake outer membrane protein [Rikenellaceae bacterium]